MNKQERRKKRIPDNGGDRARNAKIREMREEGYTFQEIADHFGISRERVRQIWPKRIVRRCGICRYCGRKFRHAPGSSVRRCNRAACAKKCEDRRAEAISEALTDPSKTWSRAAMVTLVCDGCGKTFERRKYVYSMARYHKVKRTFCTQACYHANKSNPVSPSA